MQTDGPYDSTNSDSDYFDTETTRVLGVFVQLLRASVTLDELAARAGASPMAVLEDIAVIRAAGFRVVCSNGAYRMEASTRRRFGLD